MDSEIGVEALLWGLASAVSLPLGALLGLWWQPRRRIGSSFTAFGAGALLFALTIELFGHVPLHVEEHGFSAFLATLAGALLGGVLFDVSNQYLNNRGAFLRRLSNARKHVVRIRLRRTKRLIEELSRMDVLTNLQPEHMAQIIGKVREERFKAGQTIFRLGDTGQEMYFIVSGQVEIALPSEATGNDHVALLGAHEIFGELGVLRDAPRVADARALTNVVVYKLLKSDFDPVLASSSALQEAIRELADSRINALSLKNSEIQGDDWRAEILTHLTHSVHFVSVEDIVNEGTASHASGAGLAIWLGMLIDGIPESLVIGMLAVSATGMSMSFIAGVFLANLPEAMSSAVGMSASGMGRTKIVLMWTSICVMTGAGAFLGAMILPAEPTGAVFHFVLGIEALAAGAMLTMIAETMLPEAFEQGGAIVGLSTLAGFLSTLFVKVL